uniref:PH domain-containing protein n=1 Tax=Electrophorus electricus TaxID=8005 RepID=A0A4W4HGK0_ELEEL
MSRRRVSVKELDPADHQGWLYRKNESKVFLGIKWKKYWFVLKKTSLYWYTNQMAEKADGYINLTDFLIDRAMECKKKYVVTATPQTPHFTPFFQGSLPPPYSSPVPSEATPVSTVTSRGSTSSLAKRRLSWMDLVSQANGEESAADEMEKLYRDLKKASLSPTGERRPTSRREFRASFIKRCKNNTVNDKLHLIRALNSTLKAKEADVLTLDQVLIDPSLTASKYRRWKESNVVLLQEIHLHQPPQSVPPEAPALTAAATPLTETSV